MTVEFQKVTKAFGKVSVLSDVDLEIRKGELFSLVGPSGSGKTTALRIIAGLEKHDSGHVLIGGRVVDELGPSERNVGMVFQDYALYPNKTILENIISPLVVKGVKRKAAMAEAEEMAAKLDIHETLSRRPGQISGGQQQRVALARSLIKKPEVFLLDEPFSNLDAQIRFSARKFLKEVQREFGITTIYVTHDQAEALSISDRMAVMSRGEIHQVGAPREIYRSPADAFVAAFIGSPPLNIVEVTVAGGVTSPLGVAIPRARDGKALLGIRPEHILLGAGENEAEVVALEYAGKETIVYLKSGGVEIRAVAKETGALEPGSPVRFSVAEGQSLLLKSEGVSDIAG